MKQNSTRDYLEYTTLKALGHLFRFLPLGVAFFLGRRIGDLFYYFDPQHRSLAYANLKKAFGSQLSPQQLKRLTKNFYESYGQNLIELFFIPLMDSRYLNRYIKIEGSHYISEARKRGKGVILLTVHAGSWELSNILCLHLRLPFWLFVRGQADLRLANLLNSYRLQGGGRLIERQGQIRQLIAALKNNEVIGMTADQGGRAGVAVDFFGQATSMSAGAVRLALKYDCAILPVFYRRKKGPYCQATVMPPLKLESTANLQQDIRDNLQRVVLIFEEYIRLYPEGYLWTYRIWKYAKEKNILVLSDAKAGHLRQSQAIVKLIHSCVQGLGLKLNLETREVKFKGGFARGALVLSHFLAGKYACQGCLCCLKKFLQSETYRVLWETKPDIIISSGTALAGINFVLARENLAKSIVVMRPAALPLSRFDLVVMPRHDRPPLRKNVVITEGALNLIDEEYLKEQTEKLLQASGFRLQATGLGIGLLIGGDAKKFTLRKDVVFEVIRQIKQAAEKLDADILVTTSRRSSRQIEDLVIKEFSDCRRCKLLVIANQNNIPEAVGGILGLSQIVISSPESITMISEAATTSRAYVFVFQAAGLNRKHRNFLDNCAKHKYIYLTQALNLDRTIGDVWSRRPQIYSLQDNLVVAEAIKKTL